MNILEGISAQGSKYLFNREILFHFFLRISLKMSVSHPSDKKLVTDIDYCVRYADGCLHFHKENLAFTTWMNCQLPD